MKKRKTIQDPSDEVVLEIDFEDIDQSLLKNNNNGFNSPQRDSPVKSTFEATGSLSGFMKTSHVGTSTNLGVSSIFSIPEQALVKAPEVSTTETVTEEVRALGITVLVKLQLRFLQLQ